jgi:hypothetical protein
VKITVYDYNQNGTNKLIGVFETTIQEMAQRVAIRGNADREVAFAILKEDTNTNTAKTRGFIVVLRTEIQLDESSIALGSTFINNFVTATTANTTTNTIQNSATTFRPDPPSTDVIQANPNWQPSQPSLPTLHEF